jgi:hypothetical protein
MEQTAKFKFCLKAAKTATETFQLIKQAYTYSENALPRTRVCAWYARFRDGCENLDDDESNGRSTAVRTPDMIETVQELTSTNRRITLRRMEEELEISRETNFIGRSHNMEDLR